MNKHTPGPWFPVVNEYGNIEIVTNERPYIHTVVSENECLNAADARLIAAAPEMRALLLQIHAELSHAANADPDPANWEGYTLHRIEKLLWPEGHRVSEG